MDTAIVSALIGAAFALLGVFISPYFTSRVEIDKRRIEDHLGLLKQMTDAVIADELSDELYVRVQAGVSPHLGARWSSYQRHRKSSTTPVRLDPETPSILRLIDQERDKVPRGTLVRRFRTVTTGIAALLMFGAARIYGIAFPPEDPSWIEDVTYWVLYRIEPLPFELDAGDWLRGTWGGP